MQFEVKLSISLYTICHRGLVSLPSRPRLQIPGYNVAGEWQQSNFPILVLGWRLMCSLCSLLLLSPDGELVILYLQTDQHFLRYPPSLSSYPTPDSAFTLYLEPYIKPGFLALELMSYPRLCHPSLTAPPTPTDLAPLALPHSSGSPLT